MLKKNASSKPFPARPDGTTAPLLRLGTVREACAYGRFCHAKLYDYLADGHITAYKRGNQTFIDLDSIDRWHAEMTKYVPPGKSPVTPRSKQSAGDSPTALDGPV